MVRLVCPQFMRTGMKIGMSMYVDCWPALDVHREHLGCIFKV